MDAKYLINLVKQCQATLELHASNAHEPSLKSWLELTENVEVLPGTLSQALLLARSYEMNTSSFHILC